MTSVDDKTGCRACVNATYEVNETNAKAKLEESRKQKVSIHGIVSLQKVQQQNTTTLCCRYPSPASCNRQVRNHHD